MSTACTLCAKEMYFNQSNNVLAVQNHVLLAPQNRAKVKIFRHTLQALDPALAYATFASEA